MLIPHRELSPEALQGIIEEFVTREGTDYGETEVALATKFAQIRKQLDQGLLAIVFDAEEGSVHLVEKDKLPESFEDKPFSD
jgi:uncharacterized protein